VVEVDRCSCEFQKVKRGDVRNEKGCHGPKKSGPGEIGVRGLDEGGVDGVGCKMSGETDGGGFSGVRVP
jgi:hypothetical protein